MTEQKKLEGLKGWLVLVGLGIIFGPLLSLKDLQEGYSQLFELGLWDKLTTPGMPAYDPLWAPALVIEMLMNTVTLLWGFWVAFLFLTKKKAFPAYFIGLRLYIIVALVVDQFILTIVLPHETMFGKPEALKQIFQAIVPTLIWIPYMMRSKRVKATFVR